MRRATCVAALAPAFLLCAVAHAQRPGTAGVSPEDERAARQVMAEFQDRWNAHDMKALAELCTEEADFVVISGKRVHGRVGIFEYHDALHKTTLKDRALQHHVEGLRFIRPDVAILHVRFDGSSRELEPDKRGATTARATLVVEKQGHKWLISAFHNTLVMDPACRVVDGVFVCPEVKEQQK